ncbi:hypothetical protein AWC29_12840 [Mycobacterium triplex]|uniref:BREX system P-loop protein BrxC n=1 Tax=Mycobacterium triplex TaxID=47839 RepID=A0A024K0R5_9MYCO|nr:BREX system P-loop protein BrxC [Mycobacterium triplex]ORX04789.1 hypothetical protein AWC29_12840 [Mycobacterium triplex]CDO89414.1 hypothetical protein BN973_03790 [Mycobacterium triplex]
MTFSNRDVFAIDPTERDIPNLGVAKVKKPEDDRDWETLEWELRSFVCDGEYERGLERILDQFLSHLSQAEQPAAWVSGFYGSGKSHLMRVLEYLWRDYALPSGTSARSLTTLSSEIQAHLKELSVAAKRAGGLWSAAGTLGSGASGSVRLAFLGVVFGAAGLPQQYSPARLALWMHQEGLYGNVRATIEANGKEFEHELRNLYVSPVLAQALIEAGASFGENPAAVSTALQNQFPLVDDVTNDETLDTFEEVLRLQSDAGGKLPLTLVILDEMQQYIEDDNVKALQVQDLVEGCSSRFNSQVLVVATGQAALTANPTLQKLIDRFPVPVALSDTDVETVVREVVLRKKPDKVADIEAALEQVTGEIDRQLGGTRIEAKGADKATIVADYPLLPTRRRFWERALRAIDKAGKAGVLRTQLKIVHEAARNVANQPLGTVIGGDFVFHSESASMLQSGVLLKEIDELIRGLDDGSAEGELKARAAGLVFLISQLPHEGVGDTGLRATAPILADLLVEDLASDGAKLRKDVPRIMEVLVEQGRVMKLGDEFRLQTAEGAEWTQEFNQRRASIRADAARMSSLRTDWLQRAVDAELAGLKLVHGKSKTPRKLNRHWGDDLPATDGTTVPVWIRDEWGVTEAKVREASAAVGNDSPIVFVLLPKIDAEAIADTLASYAAATDAVSQRPEPQTDEGRQAKQGMQSRVLEGQQRLDNLFATVIAKARVFQGGGNELTTGSMRAGVEAASNHALARLFPKFPAADDPGWSKVIAKARDGAPDALAVVGWQGEVPANPVCKEVLARTSGSGTKGSDLQRDLGDAPFGWPKDAVDGALLALLASGNIRAERDGHPVDGPKELPATQVGKATFFKEDEPPTKQEQLAVRSVLTEAKVAYTSGKEGAAISGLVQHLLDLAARAGGSPPLPEPPDTSHLDGIAALAGNQQIRAVAQGAAQLRQDIKAWSAAKAQRADREAAWHTLDRLLLHASTLDLAAAIKAQRDAIEAERLLLHSPDPVAPLIKTLSDALRAAVLDAATSARDAQARAIADIESSAEWQQLDPVDRSPILKDAGLSAVAVPAVHTDDELLKALDATPLNAWAERRQAIPAKVSAARAAAAKKHEPKSVTFTPPAATLRTKADVDNYLAALKEQLLQHVVGNDETVII